MDNGWVKIHRKIIENPIFKRSAYFHLWITLLLKSNHKQTKMMWNGGIIVVNEGQLITGRKSLSEETGIPESTIEDILRYLETQHQIQQQKTTKYRLVTILNWKDYQNPTAKATTKQQQADTNKNVKNDKKNTDTEQSSLIPEVIKLFEEVNPACKKMYGNTTQRKACQNLIDEYGFEEVSKVIAFLPKSNKVSYFPVVTTPVQLWDKYQTLKDKWSQKKLETKGRGIIL